MPGKTFVSDDSGIPVAEFLSDMSHELRTPLNEIIGLDSLALRNDTLDVETRDYLEKIGDSAKRLLGVINKLLEMSYLEAGGFVLRNEERMSEHSAETNRSGMPCDREKADLKGRHILFAEDMEINAQIMEQILLMKEAVAEYAINGRVALQMYEKSEVGYYDAILMDVRMPEMDGLEAAAAIRAMNRPDAKLVPIIAVSANAFDEDVRRSLEAGMNAHLAKPVNTELLYQTLEELIGEWDIQKHTLFQVK